MRDIALTTIIFGLLPFCIHYPWLGILTWNWVGLMNPHRLTWGFAHYFPFAQFVALTTMAGILFTRDRKPIPWNRELVLVVLLLAHFSFTCFFAWMPDVAQARVIDFSKVVLMVFLSTMVIFGKTRVRWLMLVVALSIGFYGFKGGLFTFATGGVHRVEGPRASFLSGNTFIGLGLCMVMPLILALAREETRKWPRVLLYVTVFFCVVSTVFTYSRGALLGLAAVLPLMFLRAKQRVAVTVLAVPIAMVLFLWAPPDLFKRAETIGEYEEDHSANMRLQSWTVAVNIAKESPIVGAGMEFEYYPDNSRWFAYAGPDALKYMKKNSVAHSIYFQVLGQHGFLGLGLFLALITCTLMTLGKLVRETRHDPTLEWIGNYAGAIRIGVVGYMVAGAFLSSAYFDLFYVFVSLCAILQRELHIARAPANTLSPGRGAPAPEPLRSGTVAVPARPGRGTPNPAGGPTFRYDQERMRREADAPLRTERPPGVGPPGRGGQMPR